MTKDYKIGYPDPTERVQHFIPLFYIGFEPILIRTVGTCRFIDDLVVFRPVLCNGDIIYRREYTFFRHLN